MKPSSETSGPLRPHRLYVHVAWSTLARVRAIPRDRQAAIETHIIGICRQLGAEPVEARALGDRVHLIVRVPAALSVGELTSRVREEVTIRLASSGRVVRWSPGFAAVTVSPAEVRRARRRLATLDG